MRVRQSTSIVQQLANIFQVAIHRVNGCIELGAALLTESGMAPYAAPRAEDARRSAQTSEACSMFWYFGQRATLRGARADDKLFPERERGSVSFWAEHTYWMQSGKNSIEIMKPNIDDRGATS